ncbi:DUF2795 domain-containing protein [Paramicrobacterium agarici]|uniref:Uncharacterized protein DUF2795 n=1 Tax=Paramicrobacterium agarici TaxID=630514 RepID=A0A2A9DZP1_9MICO|nr:DUF2795 domain-containing protein [Microbacterium agarici]PFG31801.1 uncharacterized protein DUF2795 [Microbacterium agarici]TQO21698.1 uncharacterized protein DUF2795 [Microbacterium agarici]
MAETPSPIDVQKYLGGVDYPASRDEILDRAQESGAGDDVLHALRNIPDQTYEKPTDVSAELG